MLEFGAWETELRGASNVMIHSKVVVIDPWIPCGRVFNVHAGSGYVDSIAKVKPTTIEEYQILLRLGATLKEADMPSLRVPAPSAPTTVRIYP